MSGFSSEVWAALFGNKASVTLAEAFVLIHQEGDGAHGLLLDWAARQNDELMIATMTLGRVVHSPAHAYRWLRHLDCYLFFREDQWPTCSGHLVQGVVLGLFEATVWFDEKWSAKNAFLEEFPPVCIRMITGKNHPQRLANELAMSSTYKGRLANAVKAYVKGTGNNRGPRLAQVFEIIDGVAESLGKKSREEAKVGAVGDFVLDQLTFALCGQLPATARTKALSLYFEREWGPSDRSLCL